MAPGAKKKNANRKSCDDISNNKKYAKNKSVEDKVEDSLSNGKELGIEPDSCHEKKYSKRSVTSNWQRYEESVSDPYGDKLRGNDAEVLLSYTGGSGSHLQLQDEKDWEESNVDEKSIALDLKELKDVIKNIPFHKQINLSPDIFTSEQLTKIVSSAESWRSSYVCNTQIPSDNVIIKESKVPGILDSNLNVIDNCASEEDSQVVPSNSVLLEEKTENIIESLASCLSLKNSAPEKVDDAKLEPKKEKPTLPDDLDFLLSLNVSLKNPLENKAETENKTNVDDWLNSILDD